MWFLPDFKALKKQAVGCVASVAAHVVQGVETSKDFMRAWIEIGKELSTEGIDSVQEKRAKLAGEGRITFIADEEIPF